MTAKQESLLPFHYLSHLDSCLNFVKYFVRSQSTIFELEMALVSLHLAHLCQNVAMYAYYVLTIPKMTTKSEI